MQTKRRLLLLVSLLAVFCAATAITSPAQTLSTLTNFNGTNGSFPLATLVEGSDGNFYGTTSEGGINGPFSDGTVFKVTPDGTLTTLHNFNGDDGDQPQVTLVHAIDGNFYGTTWQGGVSNYGTIFKTTTAGAFTLLHSFTGGTDGRYPGSLIQASDGNFYGTAWGGGNDNCETTGGCGVIFKITPQGNFTKIYQFQGSSNDGYGPEGLVQGGDGNFYGVTSGGDIGCYIGCGTVFKISPGGSLTTLHRFSGHDGSYPEGQLLQATDGNFYGTTVDGGANNEGTVFKMTPSGTLTSLYSFCPDPQDNCPDGANPVSGLMQATDGTLYGTTTDGGTYGYEPFGTIFKITPSGNLTTLFSFNNASNGGTPAARLLQATNGNFYGLTSGGGTSDYGTFYQFYTTGRTLSVATSGNGTVTSTDGVINCPGTCSHIYPDNTPVTLNASPAQGWGFSGWNGACGGTGACELVMTQDQSVMATFAPLYTLTVSTSGQGSVTSADGYINCPGTCSHTYVSGTQVTLNANPALGWSLTAWGGACSGSGSCSFPMRQSESVTATFTQDYYTLTVAIFGDGSVTSTDGFIDCPGTCSHTYLSLTQVTLNATAGQEWTFGGWNGGCLGTGACTFTMTQSLTLDAIFSEAEQFVAVAPCRLVDTRPERGGSGPIQGGTSQDFPIPQEGGCNIPTSAAAYSLNVSVVPQGPLGYLTIWPAGENRPVVATLNSLDGRIKADAAIVPAGTNGAVSVYVTHTTNVVLDINGYFEPASSSTLAFYPLTPCRVADTRKSSFPAGLGPPFLTGLQERDFLILNAASCNIPSTAAAYSLNISVVPHGPLGYLTVWPTGQTRPTVSTLNDIPGTIIANAAIVPAGSNGDISVYPSNDTDVIIDINGYFDTPGGGGLSLYPTPPCRVIDTRQLGPPFSGTLTPPVDVVDSQCEPPTAATAYVFNATVVPFGALGYLTLWPDGTDQPVVSTLNALDGSITNNMAIVPSTNGKVDAFASGITQLILDISSYFAP